MLRRLIMLPLAPLLLAAAAGMVAQSQSEAGMVPASQSGNLAFYGLVLLAAVLSLRGSRFANVCIWVAAAAGVRCLFTAQPVAPLPIVAWARGTGLEPPQHLLPVLFSGSVLGVGQLASTLLWSAALGAAATLSRRSERVVSASIALLGGLGTVICLLAPLPMISNDLILTGSAEAADGDAVPAYVDFELVERVWMRRTHEPAPGLKMISALIQNELSLSAIAQGIAVASYGENPLRNGLWDTARALSSLQYSVRTVAALAALISLPVCVGLFLRPADRARFLALPGTVLLWLLGGGNVVLGVLSCLLPEGGSAAVRALPFQVALLGFVVAATQAARRMRVQGESG